MPERGTSGKLADLPHNPKFMFAIGRPCFASHTRYATPGSVSRKELIKNLVPLRLSSPVITFLVEWLRHLPHVILKGGVYEK